MKPSRRELQQALKVIQSSKSTFTLNKSLQGLAQRGLGFANHSHYSVNREQRRQLKNWLHHQGVDWEKPWSAFSGDRVETAESAVDEKLAGSTDDKDRVLVSPIGPDVHINGKQVPALESAYQSILPSFISEIEAEYVLLVENIEAFKSLYRMLGACGRRSILAIYRGDPLKPYGQKWAKFFSEKCGIPLAGYMDYDPAGLIMGVQAGAEALILPRVEQLDEIKGSRSDFTNQHNQWEQVRQLRSQDTLKPYIDYLDTRRQGFTQERMIANGVVHEWIPLRGADSDD